MDWVVSYPKSGNTWCRLVNRAYHTGKQELEDLGYGGDLNEEIYHRTSPIPLDQLDTSAEMQVRQTAMLYLALQRGLKGELMKSHHSFGSVCKLPLWHPQWTRKVLNPVRDPRDVACSVKSHFGHETYDDAIDFISDDEQVIGGSDKPLHHFIGSWSSHVRSWLEAKEHGFDVFTIRYEDLLEDDVGAFYEIMDWLLEEDVDEERVESAVKQCRFDRLKKLEEKKGFAEQPDESNQFFRKGKSGGWQEELTRTQARRIQNEHGEMMHKLGYL